MHLGGRHFFARCWERIRERDRIRRVRRNPSSPVEGADPAVGTVFIASAVAYDPRWKALTRP
jgi:hypothetical protein